MADATSRMPCTRRYLKTVVGRSAAPKRKSQEGRWISTVLRYVSLKYLFAIRISHGAFLPSIAAIVFVCIMIAGSSKDSIDVVEVERPSQATTKLPDVYETEVTPLLGQNTAPQNGTTIKDGRCQMSSRAILIIMGVLILIIQCADQFAEAPLTRIFESIYCYQYWEREDPTKILIPRSAIGPGALGGVEEQWCKVAEVQGKVAMLKGTQQFLECIPSMRMSEFEIRLNVDTIQVSFYQFQLVFWQTDGVEDRLW